MEEKRDRRVDELEDRLGEIAYYWRGAVSSEDEQTAHKLIEDYHVVIAQMRQLGWNGRGLSADAQLPSRLMPPLW